MRSALQGRSRRSKTRKGSIRRARNSESRPTPDAVKAKTHHTKTLCDTAADATSASPLLCLAAPGADSRACRPGCIESIIALAVTGRTRQWKIKDKKRGYEACLDVHDNVQLRIVSKSSAALRVKAHCVRTTGDEDEKKPGNETRDKRSQRIVRDEMARGGAACDDLQHRSN
ncbi:hypothetical protein B0H13DRAFT_2486276 [Mycena leptocephala]|nr:hypothetical protein B0H13DRAFT_2486276 [Mycena leptocephala]